MKNREVSKILNEIADLYEMKDVEYKPRAYRRAAQSIESLGKDINDVYEADELDDIPGVGEGIAKKIKEYLDTGTVKKLEKLKKDIPIDIESLTAVEGLGPKKILDLYQKLGVENLDDLEQAAKKGDIREIEGFGKKTEDTILENIAFAKKRGKRFLLGYVLPEAREIVDIVSDFVEEIELAGSIRRKRETIGDVDILAIAKNPTDTMEKFTSLDKVEKVLAKGDTKSTVRLYGGVQVDLRLVEKKSFGSALQYFTGSKDHNVELRKIAQKKNWKLNEYGLFKEDKQKAGKTEQEVYDALGIQWIPPELRENRGEIEAAEQNNLPDLVELDDVKGDLQMHSKWSDGANTLEEMIREAQDLGHEFIGFTDHVGQLKIAGGMDAKDLKKQQDKINSLRKKHNHLHIFHGVEANIKKNGKLDIGKKILKQADFVLGSVHSAFRMNKKDMTKRIITAFEEQHFHILAHPTVRKLQKREPIKMDMKKIMDAAKDNNIILEINAYPERLDLNDTNVRLAVENGVKLSIGTDAHRKDHLRYYELGVAIARRGWATKKDIINTYSVNKLEKLFSK